MSTPQHKFLVAPLVKRIASNKWHNLAVTINPRFAAGNSIVAVKTPSWMWADWKFGMMSPYGNGNILGVEVAARR